MVGILSFLKDIAVEGAAFFTELNNKLYALNDVNSIVLVPIQCLLFIYKLFKGLTIIRFMRR